MIPHKICNEETNKIFKLVRFGSKIGFFHEKELIVSIEVSDLLGDNFNVRAFLIS